MRLRTAPLVLHGIGAPAARVALQLDEIGDAGDAEPVAAQRHPCDGPDPASRLCFGRVHTLMRHPALGGSGVLGPRLLDMDQGALARAEQIVLQGGECHEIGIGDHRTPPPPVRSNAAA